MSKILKYIPVLFFWLAGLTLSAHTLIPHDHHSADPNTGQEKNCPFPDNKSGHKSGFPMHCHAFNDLATDKIRLYHISQIFQYSFSVPEIICDSISNDLPISSISFIYTQKPVFDTYALELSLLRAPPSLS